MIVSFQLCFIETPTSNSEVLSTLSKNKDIYPEIEYEGRKVLVLPNGTYKDKETGYFVTGPSDESGHKITQDTARTIARKRWERHR